MVLQKKTARNDVCGSRCLHAFHAARIEAQRFAASFKSACEAALNSGCNNHGRSSALQQTCPSIVRD
jgi:hypothetical protein